MAYKRHNVSVIKERINEQSRFIQIVIGSRECPMEDFLSGQIDLFRWCTAHSISTVLPTWWRTGRSRKARKLLHALAWVCPRTRLPQYRFSAYFFGHFWLPQGRSLGYRTKDVCWMAGRAPWLSSYNHVLRYKPRVPCVGAGKACKKCRLKDSMTSHASKC